MSQKEVLNFLKKNKGITFTPKEISDNIKVSFQSVYREVNKLENRKEINCKMVESNNKYVKTYFYVEKDASIFEVEKEVNDLKTQNPYQNIDVIQNNLIIKYLKQLLKK